jgi:hypothetical protein
MGYSLGALETLFIADAQRRGATGELEFERSLAINPPVEIRYAARQFDAYFDAPLAWPEAERDRRIQEPVMKAFLVARGQLTGEAEPEPEQGDRLPLDRTESEFLIGVSGRTTLMNALLALEERGIPVLEIDDQTDAGRGPLLGPINQRSFDQYASQLIIPYYRGLPGETRSADELAHDAGLRSIGETLRDDPRIRVFTNVDDFILGEEGLAFLRDAVRERLHVFPGGGHMGNLDVPEVQQQIFDATRESRIIE